MLFDLTHSIDFGTLDLDALVAAANKDDASALFIGSYLYEGGFGRNQIDAPLAVEWAKHGADLGDPLCKARYAALMHMGRGIQQNLKTSERLLEQGMPDLLTLANAGSPYAIAIQALTTMWAIGAKKNEARALELFHEAAEKGEPGAQLYLALCYEHGTGTIKDFDAALSWMLKAAAQRYARAQHAIGESYLKGIGVPVNLKRAIAWQTLAARQNYAPALREVGFWYAGENGNRTRPFHEKAFEFVHRAADAGDIYAKFFAAEYQEKGMGGIEQNMAQAFRQYAEVVADPEFARSHPQHYQTATRKRGAMLIGKPRVTDKDGQKFVLFSDGSRAMETGPVRAVQLPGRRNHPHRRPR